MGQRRQSSPAVKALATAEKEKHATAAHFSLLPPKPPPHANCQPSYSSLTHHLHNCFLEVLGDSLIVPKSYHKSSENAFDSFHELLTKLTSVEEKVK